MSHLKRFHLAYLLLAILLAGIAAASAAVFTSGQHTKTVTKTKAVPATFAGSPDSMAAFLRSPGQQVQCPAELDGAACFQFSQAGFFVFLAVPAQGQ